MGFTNPKATMTVSSEIEGRVKSVFVDRGDVVGEGGTVAQLDTTFVILDLKKNTLTQRQVWHRLELEKKTLERYTALITNNSTAQVTYDKARVQADVLALELRNLKNEETRLREVLQRHTLRGPKGWLVIDRLVEPGEYLNKGTFVALLGNFAEVIVTYSLTIEEIGLLEAMDSIRLILPEVGREIDATIYRISPDIDQQTRKTSVDLLLDAAVLSDTNQLRGGLRAQLKIIGKEEKNAFLVPVGALKNRYESHWLTAKNGKEVKVVVLGWNEGGEFAIIAGDGLAAKESYLVNPESFKHNTRKGE